MTDNELRRLAHYIVQEQANNEQWMTSYAKAQSKLREPEKRLVGARQAAEMLGISVILLRRIKDDENGVPQFSYVKGGSKSSPLKFNAATLMEEYERYVSRHGNLVNIKDNYRKVV